MAKTDKSNAQLEEDVQFIATVLAKGVSGLMEVGIADGMKLGTALRRVTASKANSKLIGRLWARFFEINPTTSQAIEAASALSPMLASFFERIRVKPKDVPAEDATVKDAEPC